MPELDRPALVVEVGRRRAFGDPLEGGVCFQGRRHAPRLPLTLERRVATRTAAVSLGG
jgi:hypothetical protein